ncbi:MAG: acyl carrier protein [Planctomycetota bacterium]|nr:acyl carrier protein [Planctomycetota bacterium]MDP7253628.1 acyl carrier protein [Planctomycetota bacterium]
MTEEEVTAKVKEIVIDVLDVPEDQVTPEISFINDLGADSMDITSLIMDFENAFDINIPEDDANKIQTVGEAVKFIAEAVKD